MSVTNQIRLIVVLAILAFFASIGVLLFPIAEVEDFGSRSDLSMAISAVFVLVLGIIAIVIVASVERAEFRAKENLKTDLAMLAATIHGLLQKSANVQIRRGQKQTYTASFDEERTILQGLLYGSTGFALICWTGHKSEAAGNEGEKWRTFRLSLHTLCVIDVADFEHVDLIQFDCFNVMTMLEMLTEKDVKELSKYLSDLSAAMRDYARANKHDTIIAALRS